ncbi:MAG: hypothetical protein Q7R56_00600 [Nanoarchaeota archaeon]|nr:hypothetical protein [Nanoarchaeota archaeon]
MTSTLVLPQREQLIKEGYHFEHIGRKLNVTGQAIGAYARKHQIYDNWKKARQERREQLNTITQLLPAIGIQPIYQLVCNIFQQRYEEATPAEQYTINYFTTTQNPQLTPTQAQQLFTRYFELQQQGKKEGLWELGKNVGISGTNVKDIFERVGLPPINYWTCKSQPRKITKKRNKRIAHAYTHTPLCVEAIAHYEDMQKINIQAIMQRYGKQQPTTTNRTLGPTCNAGHHHASRIYEALDAGFAKQELEELLDENPWVIEYATTQRETIEPIIINALRILKQDSNIKKPYLTTKKN